MKILFICSVLIFFGGCHVFFPKAKDSDPQPGPVEDIAEAKPDDTKPAPTETDKEPPDSISSGNVVTAGSDDTKPPPAKTGKKPPTSVSSGNAVNPDTVLKAIAEEEWYIVNDLLKEGADPVLPDGDTILMKYISSGADLYYALQFPSVKATINTRNKKQGETALFLAVKKRNFDAMGELLEAGADSNISDNKGTTALSMIFEEALSEKKNIGDNFSKLKSGDITPTGMVFALKFGADSMHALNDLLRAGANPLLPDGDTVLMKHISEGFSVTKLLEFPSVKTMIEFRNKKTGETAFSLAVKNEDWIAMDALVSYGVKDTKALCSPENMPERMPGRWFFDFSRSKSLSLMVDLKRSYHTVLMICSLSGHAEGVKKLLNRFYDFEGYDTSPSINDKNREEETAFSLAFKAKHWDVMAELAKYSADTSLLCSSENISDMAVHSKKSYNTLMICSLNEKAEEDVEKLLQNPKVKSSINVPNDRGETALFLAASQGNAGIVSLLLKAGADPTIPDKEGKTPLQACGKPRRPNSADSLRQYRQYNSRSTEYNSTVKELLEHPAVRKNLSEKEIERLPLDVVVKKLAVLNDRTAIQKVLDTPVGRERLEFKPKQKTVEEIEKLLQEKETGQLIERPSFQKKHCFFLLLKQATWKL